MELIPILGTIIPTEGMIMNSNNLFDTLKNTIIVVEQLSSVSTGELQKKSEAFLDYAAEVYLSMIINGHKPSKETVR